MHVHKLFRKLGQNKKHVGVGQEVNRTRRGSRTPEGCSRKAKHIGKKVLAISMVLRLLQVNPSLLARATVPDSRVHLPCIPCKSAPRRGNPLGRPWPVTAFMGACADDDPTVLRCRSSMETRPSVVCICVARCMSVYVGACCVGRVRARPVVMSWCALVCGDACMLDKLMR